jgi:hypothetical protein
MFVPDHKRVSRESRNSHWHGEKGPYSHGISRSCGAPGAASSNYDVTPDGQRFLMIQEERDARINQINVVLNWAEELKRLMREKEK